ncbi:uncharacterized protein BDR25DRAFT_296495 [Lindgomyces ingoldianus]|uniref:Uncharacterized protein n=1 Tax=Lindgomyces ingoldianus TaxID=673940 RepID=A0ACB6QC68_9PLEO|nr:uncharacterized protein BDR25DRAFT_296495 [Lindgomyces ingoldianus]KAF2464563.1 hypothetical protein BDR25DRAFT_296495 [Lindgomyces ingoldianus]
MFSRGIIFAVALQAALASATQVGPTRVSEFLETNITDHDSTLHNRAALGTAIVSNRCDHDIWLWSVDERTNKGPIKIPKRSKYSEPMRNPCNGCGISLKISNSNQLQGGKQTQFEYAIANNQIYYDISFVDCAKGNNADNCPGHAHGLRIDSPQKSCGVLNCASGAYCVHDAYYVDDPLAKMGIKAPVLGCGPGKTNMDLYFKVCSDMAPLKREVSSVAGRIVVEKEIDF